MWKSGLKKEIVISGQFEEDPLLMTLKLRVDYLTSSKKYIFWKFQTNGWFQIDTQKGDIHPFMNCSEGSLSEVKGFVTNTRGIRRLLFFICLPDNKLYKWSNEQHPCLFRARLIEEMSQQSQEYKIDF